MKDALCFQCKENLAYLYLRGYCRSCASEHTGFCLGSYDYFDCKECPAENECLDLMAKEKGD